MGSTSPAGTLRGMSLLAALFLALVAGCGDPASPDSDLLHLMGSDGPVELLLGTGVYATGGTLELASEAITQKLALRCTPEAPGCTLPQAWVERVGVVGPDVVTPEGARPIVWSDERPGLLLVRADTAWVSFPTAASYGYFTVIFRFER